MAKWLKQCANFCWQETVRDKWKVSTKEGPLSASTSMASMSSIALGLVSLIETTLVKVSPGKVAAILQTSGKILLILFCAREISCCWFPSSTVDGRTDGRTDGWASEWAIVCLGHGERLVESLVLFCVLRVKFHLMDSFLWKKFLYIYFFFGYDLIWMSVEEGTRLALF